MHRTGKTRTVHLLRMLCAAVGLLAAGCGGGGSSTSGGGSMAASSTLVLKVASVNGRVTARAPSASLLARLGDLLAAPAWAATAGVEVYLDGGLQGVTDAAGEILFPVTAGLHTVRLVDPASIDPATGRPVEAGFTLAVPEDTIVTIENITVADGTVTYDPPDLGDGTEGRFAHKTTICHKDKRTLSVGDPAVPAHLAHGDSLGPCTGQGGGEPDGEEQTGGGKPDKGKDRDKKTA